MILFKKAAELTNYLKTISETGRSIGFVPTMGALHNGHLELVNACRRSNALCVSSIFINPTQFNDPKDFEKYPVTIEKDMLALEQSGCDVLFLPAVNEVYPGGTVSLSHFELGYLETILEGKYRPGHFQGVCQVMDRLLRIVMPDELFMGRKDYQQCMVIKRLIQLNNWNINLAMVPTVRETSGLAMSSRNMRLDDTQKQNAVAIYKALQYLKTHIKTGNTSHLITTAEQIITAAGFEKTDYVAMANADTLQPVTDWDGQQPLVGLVAAFMGGVRLIDNMPL